MKILILQFPLQPAWGGAEAQTLLLAEGMSARGHQVELVSSNRELVAVFNKAGLKAKFRFAGWEPTSAAALLLFPLTLPVAFFSIATAVLFSRCRAVFCLSLTDKLIATPLANPLAIKVVWMEHTRLGRWFFQNPLLPAYRLFARSARIVAPSYFLRNQLVAGGIPIERIRVIYPGIDPEKNSPPRAEGVRGGGKFVLGFLGRLAQEKGADVLIRALAAATDDIRLKIAGTGPQEAYLKELVRTAGLSGRVDFLGPITEKKSYFKQIDALVVPSVLAEAFGLVAAEGMSAGVPVIASRIGALSEIIENKKTGLLFEPGNAMQLAQKIGQLRKNPEERTEMVQRAVLTAQSRFSSVRLLAEILSLL